MIGWPVRFTRHSSPSLYTLTLANRTPGGPILNILRTLPNGTLDTANPIFSVSGYGVMSQKIGGYLDFAYQDPAPPGPGPATDLLRMYARGGQLFFKAEDSAEQQIPIGEPPGPGLRWAHWLGGG